MLMKTDTALVIDTKHASSQHVVYEHQATFTQGGPPETIFIGSCPLHDVFKFFDARNNSDWTQIYRNGGQVMVRIIAIADDPTEARRYAMKHARSFNPMPRCNLYGHNLAARGRPVECIETGEQFPNQKVAADIKGIDPGALSRHLKGKLKQVKGLTFRYGIAGAE